MAKWDKNTDGQTDKHEHTLRRLRKAEKSKPLPMNRKLRKEIMKNREKEKEEDTQATNERQTS